MKGLGVSIAAGEEFDLDAIGRESAEKSPQVVVAFEEGYLSNVFKQPGVQGKGTAPSEPQKGLLTTDEFHERLESFKKQFLDELKGLHKLDKLDLLEAAPKGGSIDMKAELAEMRKAITSDVRGVLSEMSVAKEKIEAEKRRILADANLSQSEIKARLAFLEEKERELEKNFETVGRTVERNDGDVMDKADLLSGL
jgi:hypothetical protein